MRYCVNLYLNWHQKYKRSKLKVLFVLSKFRCFNFDLSYFRYQLRYKFTQYRAGGMYLNLVRNLAMQNSNFKNRVLLLFSTSKLGQDQSLCPYTFRRPCTLVYLINMQHVLINFLKNSNLHGLITSCTFIKFWKFSSLHDFYVSNFLKIPTCTALLHPARLLILGNFPACTIITSCTFIRYSRVAFIT